MAWLNERAADIHRFRQRVEPSQLADLIGMVAAGRLSVTAAKSVFNEVVVDETDITVRDSLELIVKRLGVEQVNDDDAIRTEARAVIDENPDEVARYLAGKEQLLQFFVGQLMKRTRGKANPKTATEILTTLLSERR